MLQKILNYYEKGTFGNNSMVIGFEEAVIGVCETFGSKPRIIYSMKACVEIMANKIVVEETELDAYQTVLEKKNELAKLWLGSNVLLGYRGEQSPIFCFDNILFLIH